MTEDYAYFSMTRELFPRHEDLNSRQLICGHLNRMKFPPSVEIYLSNREKGVRMTRALAKASRCKCYKEDVKSGSTKGKLMDITDNFATNKRVIKVLETIEIAKKHPQF